MSLNNIIYLQAVERFIANMHCHMESIYNFLVWHNRENLWIYL